MPGTYTPASLGISAPSGGFQNGGWYGGREYVNGTLGDPGQFHPQDTQAGHQGQAPVQNQADATYLTNLGDKGAQGALVPQPSQAPAPTNNTPSYAAPSGASTPGTGIGYTAPSAPSIDLPSLYTSLTAKSGVGDINSKIADLGTALATAKGQINDNPYLSESDRTGRVSKLESDYQAEVAPLQNQVDLAQADTQVQLNIAQSQYNINEAQYQSNVSMVNNLLSSGMLDNANAQDIAQISQATGLSTSMVQSVISSSKATKAAANKPMLTTLDDGKNQYVVAVDPTTGTVISKNIIGASKPSGTGTSLTAYEQLQLDNQGQATFNSEVNNGITQLEKGIPWGDVWNRLHQQFPQVTSKALDNALGPQWKQPGYYQSVYAPNQGKVPLSSNGQ